MNKARIAKLKAAGWNIGSTADFLKLSPEESTLIEIKITLAASLRDLRIQQDLTQHALAEFLGSSQSRVAKMESADPTVSIDLLLRSLVSLGVTQKELARILSSKAA